MEAAVPVTPLQVGAYLDMCTEWLTAEPVLPDAPPMDAEPTVAAVQPPPCNSTEFAYTQTERRRFDTVCSVCKRQNVPVESVSANPFTQRCLLSVCRTCMPT